MHRSRWLIPLCLTLLVVSGCAQVPATPEEPLLPTSAQAGETTIVAVAPPGGDKCCSIWDFMGVGQIIGGARLIGTRIRSRLGARFPGLEPRPPLLPITDPANLGPEASPAVQTAAEVKAEEDQAAQKAKAINYLSMIGCGGCDRGVEEALIAALDDCTEEVRYAAAKAFRDLSGSPCAVCKTDACCSEEALRKLHKIANETKNGCYLEPSPRVRRMARLAMAGCGGYVASFEPAEALPEEGPTPADLPAGPPPAGSRPAGPPPAPPAPAGPTPGVEARSILRNNPSAGLGAPSSPAEDPIVAEVNGEAIHQSDLAPRVEARLRSIRELAGTDPTDAVRRAVQRRELEQLVEHRLLFQVARQQLPLEQIDQVAYQTLVSPGRRPERILADMGSRHTVDQAQLVKTWLDRKVEVDPRVSEEELKRYYHEHLSEYQTPPRVRWEQVTVPAEAGNSRHHAQSVIRYLRAVSEGKPISPAPVFQRQNVMTHAHPLTPLDRVPSRRLAADLMNLPVGRISEPWEDQHGWHLTRVLQRQPARTLPFDDVRESVRESVLQQRRLAAGETYVEQLRQSARVWTVFQEDSQGADEPIAEVPEGPRPQADPVGAAEAAAGPGGPPAIGPSRRPAPAFPARLPGQ